MYGGCVYVYVVDGDRKKIRLVSVTSTSRSLDTLAFSITERRVW